MPSDYYDITIPAIAEPVVLADAKAWCRTTHSSEDAIFTALIKSAVLQLESYTNRVFSTRTYAGYFSGLSCPRYEKGPIITLRRSPLISVTSVSVGGEVIDPTTYDIKQTSGFSRIVFNEIPEYEGNDPYPVEAVFTAGYTTVPEDIKTAIKQYVCLLYSARGDCDIIPKNIKTIVSYYRILNTFG
jgi:uncharacterized phiE125 gp8 family phage protein